MMSFGAARLDRFPSQFEVPPSSLLAGMLGAALGVERRQVEILQALQDGLGWAAVVINPGRTIRDFQTADLAKPRMTGPMWTTSGIPRQREGSGITEKRIVERPYLAGAHVEVVLWDLGLPTGLAEIREALGSPARPVYLGRSNCPAPPDFEDEILEADGPIAALGERLHLARVAPSTMVTLHLPIEHAARLPDGARAIPYAMHGRRDWAADAHVGSDVVVRAEISASLLLPSTSASEPDGVVPECA
jgi:CRISPR-associated protein Cas5/CasD subtype I-E